MVNTSAPPPEDPASRAVNPSPHIPLEIIALVIEHTQPDRCVLASCSLVCTAWFPFARQHLFSNIALHAENISSFINLVSSSPSALPPFINCIDVRDNRENARWLANTQLISGLTCLADHVTSLSITSDFDPPLSYSTLAAFRSFERLVELKLSGCVFGRFSDAQEFICSFPVLQTLLLEAEWPEPYPHHPSLSSASIAPCWCPAPTLRELDLKCEIGHVLDWLVMLSPAPNISILALDGVDVSELSSINRYLQSLGSSLTHLEITPFSFVNDQSNEYVIDISHNSHLKHLKLEIDCDISGLTLVRDTLLWSGDKARLTDLELVFYCLRKTSKMTENWASLDEILWLPQFSSLRTTVYAKLGGHLAREVLPKCYSRSTLRVKRS